MSNLSTKIISAKQITNYVNAVGLNKFMDVVIAELENGFKNLHLNKIVIKNRDGFIYNKPNYGLLEWMPAMHITDSVYVKMIAYHPENPDVFALPTIIGSNLIFDAKTGHLKTILDGVFSTAIRTGAASAIATKYFAIDTAETIGLVGCGAQAVTQLHAISRIRNIKKVLLFDIDVATMQSFADRIKIFNTKNEFTIEQVSLEEVAERADILCTATSSKVGSNPVLHNGLKFKKHVHINAVGSDMPGKIEISKNILEKSFIFPDYLSQAMLEGECQQFKDNPNFGPPEISDIIANFTKYSMYKETISVFDSTGFALEDLVISKLLDEVVKDFTTVNLESITNNPKNPYEQII